jgi:hypothetical protein
LGKLATPANDFYVPPCSLWGSPERYFPLNLAVDKKLNAKIPGELAHNSFFSMLKPGNYLVNLGIYTVPRLSICLKVMVLEVVLPVKTSYDRNARLVLYDHNHCPFLIKNAGYLTYLNQKLTLFLTLMSAN